MAHTLLQDPGTTLSGSGIQQQERWWQGHLKVMLIIRKMEIFLDSNGSWKARY
jgi:hypothetical protein